MRVFSYPVAAHLRRHGPRGYADYKHYKPWLRDEFAFRCVYCLCRETWLPDGQAHFSVDHVSPRGRDPGPGLEYDRLVYACSVCNACKGDFPDLAEIDCLALSEHLAVDDNGMVESLSRIGETVVSVCALNRPELVAFRRDLLALLAVLERSRAEEAALLRRRYLGYPDDLPDLGARSVPRRETRVRKVSRQALLIVAAEKSCPIVANEARDKQRTWPDPGEAPLKRIGVPAEIHRLRLPAPFAPQTL